MGALFAGSLERPAVGAFLAGSLERPAVGAFFTGRLERPIGLGALSAAGSADASGCHP